MGWLSNAVEKHHRAEADGARDIAAVARAQGNKQAAKVYEDLARKSDAKADRRGDRR